MSIGPLIFWHALDAALLNTILASESLQFRIQAVTNFERFTRHSTIIGYDFRHGTCIFRKLLDIFFEIHRGWCKFGLPVS